MIARLTKMNGLGNDFLIYDAIEHKSTSFYQKIIDNIPALSNRNNQQTGGCDQFIILSRGDNEEALRMEIYNMDGSQSEACGNATRCVVSLIEVAYPELIDKNRILKIETLAGLLKGKVLGDDLVEVELPAPIFNWKLIPLSEDVNISGLPIEVEGFEKPYAVSIGNPHMVFFGGRNIEELDLNEIGPDLESHPLYPNKTNVSFANIIDKDNIRLRVFERGVGETKACGTAACATQICSIMKGYTNNEANIHLKGGVLTIIWNGERDSNIKMIGKTEYEREVEVGI
jgi:diaminopimelate epimerase